MTDAITAIAFDYGTRHLGVAVGQTLTGTANPLPPQSCKDGIPRWENIATVLKEWQPKVLVVGLPLNMDGSESGMSQRARKFANRLHGRYGLPVELVDERLSSFEAKSRMEVDDPNRRRGGELDSLAAVVILEHWLAART